MIEAAVLVVAVLLALGALGLALGLLLRLRRLRKRFANVVDIDAEVTRVRRQLDSARLAHEQFVQSARQAQEQFDTESRAKRGKLQAQYEQARTRYEALKREVSLLEENLEDISFGLYRPHFNFNTSEAYKQALQALRAQERDMIRDNTAARCDVAWQVGGSAKEGERMKKQTMKVLLRAFNGECDAALANVTWNNITRMEERLNKSFDAINKLGGVLRASITDEYRRLKIAELRLAFEYQQKRHDEQEEQRRIREQMREEERAQREAERAREEAEREEARFQSALERARAEAARAQGDRLQELNERIKALEGQVEQAHQQKERAISLAQITKSGHVYVISNIGSFGQDVYKVGMTRRFDPLDRVKELGDASVPFPFDIHAMIWSNDAPSLEDALHKRLEPRRINLVNPRKEFFRVTLKEIEDCAHERGHTVEFTRLAEAMEYRETIAMRAEDRAAVPVTEVSPQELFTEGASAVVGVPGGGLGG